MKLRVGLRLSSLSLGFEKSCIGSLSVSFVVEGAIYGIVQTSKHNSHRTRTSRRTFRYRGHELGDEA